MSEAQRSTRVALWLVGLIAIPSVARAAPDPLAQAEAAYANVDFAETERLARAALQSGGYDRGQMVRIYFLLGVSAAADGKDEEAIGAFKHLLTLDPETKLDRGLSPKLQGPMLEARGTPPVPLGADVVFDRARGALHFTLHDPLAMSRTLVVRSRLSADAAFAESNAPATASVDVLLPGSAGAEHVEYSVRLLDDHLNRLWEKGSDAAPEIFQVAAAVPSAQAQTGGGRKLATKWLATGIIGELLGVAGLAGGVGAYFVGKHAADRWNDDTVCLANGQSRSANCSGDRDTARAAQSGAIASFAIGGALIAASTILLIAAPRTPRQDKVASLQCGAGPGTRGPRLRRSVLRPAWLIVLCAASGCFSLKSGNDVAGDMSANTGGDMAAGCWDPTGFGGRGCFTCTPTTTEQLLNACTQATCTAYDNTALALGDGGLPALPTLDFSVVPAAPPPDMSSTNLAGSPSPQPDMAPALPACSSLTGGKVVYATGSTAAGLFLGNIAQPLEHAATPVTVVYQSVGSCIGVSALVTPSTTKMKGTAVYWDPNTSVDPSSASAQLKCQLADSGVNADIGFSDVFATTCQSLPGGLDPSIKDYFGPVQTMTLIVPQNSSAQAISAEAAYLVYGFGAYTHLVMPWVDPLHILQRNSSSGTQSMIAATIGVPQDHWLAKFTTGSSDIRTQVINAGSMGQDTANKTVGILSADGADPFRANLHELAFQDYNQRCGFFPDSTSMARDKANVRDGHYANFGPLHMLTNVNGSGVPINSDAATVLDAVTGVAPPAGVDIIDLFAKLSLIPQCAMRVTRAADGGEIKPFLPSPGCSCYYTERATGLVPPPGCTVCSTQGDCPMTAPNCNKFAAQTKGYCEP